MYYVYEIYDLYGSVVKVGQTSRPNVRKAEHLRRGKYKSHSYIVVESFENKTDALDREEELQLEYELISDRQKAGRGGQTTKKNGNQTGGGRQKRIQKIGGHAAASIIRECPNCKRTCKGPSYFNHIKKCN